MSTAKIKVATYIEEGDHEKLKELAKTEKRSISSQLSKIVNDYFSRNTNDSFDSSDAGNKAIEFLRNIATGKKPTAVELVVLGHILDIPIKVLEEIVVCASSQTTENSESS